MRDDLIDDARGAILHGTNDAEQHTACDTPPGAMMDPDLALQAFFPFNLARAPWAQRSAGTAGFMPPARPWQSKTSEDSFVRIEQANLAVTGTVLEHREVDGSRGQVCVCLKFPRFRSIGSLPLAELRGQSPH